MCHVRSATNNIIAVTGVYAGEQKNRGQPNASPAQGKIMFDIGAWWLKGTNISGGTVIPERVDLALRDLITAGRAKPSFVFDKVIDIEEAPEAYMLFREHKVQKVVIRFGHYTWPSEVL